METKSGRGGKRPGAGHPRKEIKKTRVLTARILTEKYEEAKEAVLKFLVQNGFK